MYWTYLRRELSGRKKQTAIVATGLAIAIALVIIVNALSAGVRDAQTQALESVYGVGTDLTVTGAQVEPGEGGRGGPQFDFDEDAGATAEDGTTNLSQSRLSTDVGRSTLDAATLDTAAGVDGVAAVAGALSLTNSTFSGELPQRPADGAEAGEAPADGAQPPAEGGGGFGGGSFGIESFRVLGVDASTTVVGPLSAVTVTDGRMLDAGDDGQDVAVLDATYAASAELAVGDTIDVAGTDVEIVGTVTSATSSADTAADVYLPLDVAQELSGAGDVISTIYLQATSSDDIAGVQTALEEALPEATVSSQSDLAATVSGSLASAGALITSLGTWLSVIVLAVAVALAVLLTLSGITRRTREIGTLKAIGWSDRRVVGQIAGESVVQSLIGGAAGIVLGLIGVVAINIVAPTISSAPTAATAVPGGAGGRGGAMPGGASLVQTATDIVLSAPLSVGIILAALALAVAGGLVAGAVGGWRAARLRPAEALRAIA